MSRKVTVLAECVGYVEQYDKLTSSTWNIPQPLSVAWEHGKHHVERGILPSENVSWTAKGDGLTRPNWESMVDCHRSVWRWTFLNVTEQKLHSDKTQFFVLCALRASHAAPTLLARTLFLFNENVPALWTRKLQTCSPSSEQFDEGPTRSKLVVIDDRWASRNEERLKIGGLRSPDRNLKNQPLTPADI
ncbi:hypothetical protein K0M31_011316 [Melipona bicolor]|uniref:Uncharacterized protein n=1 Tax=Melipona bicolor TaxID=60889 RepID=A0AA40GAI4_9HYME|nr:hypothetical protein K0M31_011316 [Melipona bicolor]